MTEVFCELDHYDKVVMKDLYDVVTNQQCIERLRVHIFLVGSNNEFKQISREILYKETTPDLKECYALIHHETVCRVTLKGKIGSSRTSAMIT